MPGGGLVAILMAACGLMGLWRMLLLLLLRVARCCTCLCCCWPPDASTRIKTAAAVAVHTVTGWSVVRNVGWRGYLLLFSNSTAKHKPRSSLYAADSDVKTRLTS